MIHAQLTMYCSNLNSHLFSLHVVDNEQCMCGYRVEDTRHYFMFCPLYDNIRGKLLDFYQDNHVVMTEDNLLYGIEDESSEINKELFDLVHEFIELSERF